MRNYEKNIEQISNNSHSIRKWVAENFLLDEERLGTTCSTQGRREHSREIIFESKKFKKMKTKSTHSLVFRIRKKTVGNSYKPNDGRWFRKLTVTWNIKSKEADENIVSPDRIVYLDDRTGTWRESKKKKYIFRTTKDRKMSRAMIAFLQNGHDTQSKNIIAIEILL